MPFKIHEKIQNNYIQKSTQLSLPTNLNHIVGFTPKISSVPNTMTIISLYKDPEVIFSTTSNKKLVKIPSNTLIKEIYFYGKNGFDLTGTEKFSIGFGDLNSKPNSGNNFIIDGTSAISNSLKGGYRNFASNKFTGENEMFLVSSQSFLNVSFSSKYSTGFLKVVLVLETLK